MPLFFDRVRQAVSAAPGTGSIALGAAAASFRTFAQAGATNGMLVNYVIEDGSAWEYGVGTYNTTGPSLARTTILGSSNGGAAIDGSAAAIIFCDALAANLNGFQSSNQVRLASRRATIRYAVR